MKPDSPVDERVNADDSSLMSQSVLDNGQGDNSTDDLDIDMDDEVMTFMHSNIHSEGYDNQPRKSPLSAQNSSSGDVTKTNQSWDAPIVTAKENALAPDDYSGTGRISRHSECSIEPDLQTERDNILEEEDALDLARRLEKELAGSIVALWQQRLTQSSSFEGDIDIEYASESEPATPVPDDPSVIVPSLQHFSENAQGRLSAAAEDLNGNSPPANPMAPVRLAMPTPGGSGANANTALEEIRSRLRKTKFDYSSDSRTRISDATPAGDFRNVLKKKNKA